MSKRAFGSLLIGILVGLAVGLYIGWVQFPVSYTNSSLAALAPGYQEEYTVMIAEGYQYDGDVAGAVSRLEPLGKENVFDFIQDLTERYISQSNVPAIPPMVALSEAVGRLTPIMDVYRQTPVPSSNESNP